MRAVARGCAVPVSRLGGHLEVLTRLAGAASRAAGHFRSSLRRSCGRLTANARTPWLLSQGCYIAELTDALRSTVPTAGNRSTAGGAVGLAHGTTPS